MPQTRLFNPYSPLGSTGEKPMRRAIQAARLQTSLASSAGALSTGIRLSEYLIYVESDEFF